MSCCCSEPTEPAKAEQDSSAEAIAWLKLAIAAILSGLTMYISLGVNIESPEGTTRTVVHSALAIVAIGVILGLGSPIIVSAWKQFRRKRITLEHAFLLGIFGSLIASIYSSVTGEGAIYYEVVVILISIYLFGQTIKERQIRKRTELASMIPGLYGEANVLIDGSESRKAVSEIVKGERLVIRESETVPADCFIIEGEVYIEQQAHTGETYPQPKGSGDRLLAGSVVLDGEILVEATASGKEREIDRLLSALDPTFAESTHSDRLAQKILNVFVPSVLIIAGLTGVVWTLMGHPLEGFLHAFTVTVVACPCALGIAIPLATRRGIAQLKLLGIVSKHPTYVDLLTGINHIAFDKTGTLSQPTLGLSSFDVASDAPAALTSWIVEIQNHSTHPVARPFWRLDATPVASVSRLEIQPMPGRGIRADFQDASGTHELLLGNAHLLIENGIPTSDEKAERAIYAIYQGKIAATAHLSEDSREESVETLRELLEAGYRVSILTGDSHVPDGYRLPGVEIFTGLSSQDKARRLDQLDSQTLYIGDGLNDCEGFQKAHASLALENGSHAAKDIAQSTLLHNDLSVVPKALATVKALEKRLRRILLFSFIYNLVGISLAAFGILNPVVAAVLMFASSIFVISFLNRVPSDVDPGNWTVRPLGI